MPSSILHNPSESEKQAASDSIFATHRARQLRARRSDQSLQAATQNLIRVLADHSTDQAAKVRAIIWSTWNGHHLVGLCDALSGLDHHIAESVLALIEARLFLGGDADDMIRYILDQSGEMDRFQTSGTNHEP